MGSVHEMHLPAIRRRGITDRQRHRGGTGAGVSSQDPYAASLKRTAVRPLLPGPEVTVIPVSGLATFGVTPARSRCVRPRPSRRSGSRDPLALDGRLLRVPVLEALRRFADSCCDTSGTTRLHLSEDVLDLGNGQQPAAAADVTEVVMGAIGHVQGRQWRGHATAAR